MKYKIILFTFFLLSTSVVFSQTKNRAITLIEKTDSEKAIFQKLEIEQAKYRAKYRIKEIVYYKIQSKNSLDTKPKKQLHSRHFFDEKGRLISIKFNNSIHKELKRGINNSNDESLIKKTENNSGESVLIKNRLIIDAAKITYYSSLLDHIRYFSIFKNKFKLDRSKRIKKWTTYNMNNSQKIEYFYFYNRKGFSRKEIHFNSWGNTRHSKKSYSNKISYSILKEYNIHGFEIKSRRYLNDKVLDYVTITEYKYFEK
ncbi:hypothetical protein [Polaribacter sp. Z022]|uniref:hypothetical protein n=1 Tax=Polaribacter sp. Z022 TaxID=2927125 RepID=UPI0020201633|nr:hypothetical protein [Polaribacter sp. Z022]MCL7754359.1 hypothetical protein [Polaribacter sp. Z022]